MEELASEFETGHAGHGEVGDSGGEVSRAGAEIGEGGGGVDVTDDLVAHAFEQAGAEQDEAFFVVDVEDVLVMFAQRGGFGGGGHGG